jgi:ElaB/YqjD/DUF883 family membrane-anchored ribosome-binding protein
MKKVALLLLFLPVFVTACKKEQEQIEKRTAFINFFGGDVTITSEGKKLKAQIGEKLGQGDVVETGEKSFVDLVFGANIIKILENTTIEITQLTQNLVTGGEDSVFFIKNGRVISRIAKKLGKDDSFKMKTPTSIAAVRGTDFLIEERDGVSHIACSDGKLLVERLADSLTVSLEAGQEVVVEPDKPLNVKDLSQTNRDNINEILGDIKDLQDDIRKRFEEERDRIRKEVEDLKEQNKEVVQKQRDEDRQRVDDQKASDRANIDAIKGKINSADLKPDADDIKVDTQSIKPDIKGVKPDIKKRE